MNSLVSNIKNFFRSAPVKDSCELQNLKREEKNAKSLNAPQPRAQHSASIKSFLTSVFARVSFPLPSFSGGSRARTSFSLKVSETLDKLAVARESNHPGQIIASLKTLQELQRADAVGWDDALKTHLLMKSKHNVRRNPIQAAHHMRSLSEANPARFQSPGQLGSDEGLNQFHADLMKRLEEQYGKAFEMKKE